MNQIFSTIITLIVLSISQTVFANGSPDSPALPSQADRVVKDSYIVAFKEPVGTESPIIWPVDRARNLTEAPVPFGEHSTGQSKAELAKTLGIKGQVVRIFETINAVQIRMDSEEAYKLSLDERVLRVSQEQTATLALTQINSGWALDRLDEVTPVLDDSFTFSLTGGAGQTIWILDSGLDLNNSIVAGEFGGRASIFYDFNPGGTGVDCLGHGTQVASAAAGLKYGVAKGATLKIVKITSDCTGSSLIANSVNAINWLAVNAPPGTIVNWSSQISAPYTLNYTYDSYGNLIATPTYTCGSKFDVDLENSIKAAYNAGIIVVVAAGNDGCNTANYSPTNIPEAFVAGATQKGLIVSNGLDAIAKYAGNGGSRRGWNISTFAPGKNVDLLSYDGIATIQSGTSFAAPYVAGLFALACQSAAGFCSQYGTGLVYTALRGTGTLNTVTNAGGAPLTGATSRFIYQQW